MDSYVAEVPAMLDSFLLATPILQVLLWGRGWGTTKWRVNFLCKHKTAKFTQLVLLSAPHNAKQLHPCPTSLASCVVIYSRLAACPVEMEPFKDHPSTRGYLTSLRIKPWQKQPVQLSALIPA